MARLIVATRQRELIERAAMQRLASEARRRRGAETRSGLASWKRLAVAIRLG